MIACTVGLSKARMLTLFLLCTFTSCMVAQLIRLDDGEHFTEFLERGVALCNSSTCTEISYCHLENRYSNLFMTVRQFADKTNLTFGDENNQYANNQVENNQPTSGDRRKRALDGDTCCMTNRGFTTKTVSFSIGGELCLIIRTPVKFQFVVQGLCSAGGSCTDCQQTMTYVSLLAWCPAIGFKPTFQLFESKSHCICAT